MVSLIPGFFDVFLVRGSFVTTGASEIERIASTLSTGPTHVAQAAARRLLA